jgi:hypothetical protein
MTRATAAMTVRPRTVGAPSGMRLGAGPSNALVSA